MGNYFRERERIAYAKSWRRTEVLKDFNRVKWDSQIFSLRKVTLDAVWRMH